MNENTAKIGRNGLCHCGSGKKYKHCCLQKDQKTARITSSSSSKLKIPSKLQPIYDEINRINNPQDMPRRIELCRRALDMSPHQVDPLLWAEFQVELGDSLIQNPYGQREDNLGEAIYHYQEALQVITQENAPLKWFQIMNSLAAAYRKWRKGKQAENAELAIKYDQQMLKFFTSQAFPEQWASIQFNLAIAYSDRINGERADNIERAIECYQQMLKVYTRKSNPELWAATQNQLAIAYWRQIRGERADNIELAIEHYQQALEVYTRKSNPELWATAQDNLANAYSDRINGERADNIEQAIERHKQALEVRTRQAFPEQWATTQNNLGNAYRIRLKGERADNIELAIEHLKQALEERTRQAFPEQWATTQNNLAIAYSERINGERADNIELAIEHYKQALEVRTRQAFPEQWAMTQNNLANAYRERIEGVRADNIEQAIHHFQRALEVRTRQAFPVDWAMTQNNLAAAFHNRIKGERVDNIEQTIQHYFQALEVLTLLQFPADHQITSRNLGNLYFAEAKWAEAHTAYEQAIAAEKILLTAAHTEIGRYAEVAETSKLYARSAYALLQLGQPDQALAQLERGKTRLLTQSLALIEADISALPAEQQNTLLTLHQTLHTLEGEMRLPSDTPARRDDRTLAQALEQTYRKLNETIEAIREENPDFMPTGLDLPELLALIPVGGVLIAPVVTSQGGAMFVVPHGVETVTSDHVVWLDEFTDESIYQMLQGPSDNLELGGWLDAYFRAQQDLEGWLATIEATCTTLAQQLVDPILEKLTQLGIERGASLLLMPQGGLGLLPLHAGLLDDYSVTYVPSGYALHAAKRRLQANGDTAVSLLMVVNPTGDLPFTPAEGDAIVDLFAPDQVTRLGNGKATIDRVSQNLQPATCNLLHFSGHGFYNWEEVMQSGLVLADGALTLSHLISQADLSAVRLVTLSACETGITDIRQSPDEFLGLPVGLMQAGAPAVISTLWAVNDLSTMLLMERFYHNYLREEIEIAEALRQAQLWLRDVTAGELTKRFGEDKQVLFNHTRLPDDIVISANRRFSRDFNNPEERPFEHPFHWAAFTFSGA